MKGHARDVNCPEERKAGEKRIGVQVFPSVKLRDSPCLPTIPSTHSGVQTHVRTHIRMRTHTGPLGLPAVQVSSGAPHPAVLLSKDTVLTGVWHTDTHTGCGASYRLSKHVWNKPSAPWKKTDDQTRQHIKKQRNYVASKGLCNQSYGFSSSQVWM